MLYAKSLTRGGLFPLGGSGGPFLPHPSSAVAAASPSITRRMMAAAGFILAGRQLIKLPAPNCFALENNVSQFGKIYLLVEN